MKGYAFKEGKISLKENVDRVTGTIELPNGETCDVDLPVDQVKCWFNPENALMALDAFDYATSVPRPVKVEDFGFWLDNDRWYFTSWEEVDDATKVLNFMFDGGYFTSWEGVDDATKVLNFMVSGYFFVFDNYLLFLFFLLL